MKKFSVLIAGRHMTSITLENEFYDTLKDISKARKRSINNIVTEIDSLRGNRTLSGAIRVYILNEVKKGL